MNKKKIGIFIAVLMLLMSGCFISQKEKTVQTAIDKITIYIASDMTGPWPETRIPLAIPMS